MLKLTLGLVPGTIVLVLAILMLGIIGGFAAEWAVAGVLQ